MSLIAAAVTLHTLSAVVWVGGMFFAWVCLRPAAGKLPADARQALWADVFRCFFPWVWVAVSIILLSGYGLIFGYFGGMAHAPIFVHVMQALGLTMMALFAHVFFAPYGRLRRAVAAGDVESGGRALAQIRKLVGLNLLLGLAVVIIAVGGRFFS
ncbi:MAG: CopD family protein [Gammaproteobacteria bacterium]|jgi:uncharacterized membrane protein